MSTVSAILLAAGESRRMGEVNKLELDIGGRQLLRRTAETLLASKLKEIVVVLGHEAEKTHQILADLPLSFVINEAYQEGQMTSVYKGLLSLKAECDGVMVCLSDQPLLEADDIDVLMDAFNQRSHGSILVPTYKGQRGNPIIFDFQNRQKILDGERNFGCKKLIEKNPEQVCKFEMSSDHCVVDLDTPEQYAAFTAAN